MLPSMPLLMTPIKKEISQNEDDQHTDNRTPMPTQTKNIFVDVMETEQCQPCMDESHNKKEINQSPFSPPSIEVQNISNKKIISPRQSKITRQRIIDTMAKKNEIQQKQNQSSASLQNLLIPVKTADAGLKAILDTTCIKQDVEIAEGPHIEKLNPEVKHSAKNRSTPPQHKVEGKEGTAKGRTPSSITRRSKKQRELEASIAALKPESAQQKEERARIYAETYFMKVKERLEPSVYTKFVEELVYFKDSNNTDAVSLYRRMETLLSPHKDLIDEFLAFLLPDQAKQIGRLIDYLLLVKMKDFISKLEVLLTKQCNQVYSSLEHLASLPNVTLTDVHNAILPHLKSSPLLTDYFLELLPRERPPDSLMIDYEQADCFGRNEEDICYEMIHIPDYYDPYGGENCPCKCHEIQSYHCIRCGIKYINGRVYLHQRNIIRSAKVIFEKEDQEKMLEMKWKGRGEPDISYSKYHRRWYFPTPVKVSAADHVVNAKKSPRTPRTKAGNTQRSRNLKTASRGSCSAKSLPLIEGIMPLASKPEYKNQAETEIKHNDIKKEIKCFGELMLTVKNQPKGVKVSDDTQCHAQVAAEEQMCIIQDVDKTAIKDLEVEEPPVMSIEEEDTKSPTCSQIMDIPSVLSPMSFFSESLHCDSGFELINKHSTNTSTSLSGKELHSVPQQLMSFNQKSPALQTIEEDIEETNEILDTQADSNKASSKTIKEIELDSLKSTSDDESSFSDVKMNDREEELKEKSFENRNSVVGSGLDSNKECDNISESVDESIPAFDSNQFSVDNEVRKEIANRTKSPIQIVPPPDKIENRTVSNVEKKTDVDSEAEPHSSVFVNLERKREGSPLNKYQSKRPCFTSEQRNKSFESGSHVSDQNKINLECNRASTPDTPCWTREEDKIILQAFQQEGDSEQTFTKINQLIPSRTVNELKNRFQVLLQLLQQMTGITEDTEKLQD